MPMKMLGLAVIAGAWLIALPGDAKNFQPFKSVKVKLPDNQAKFPAGAGSEVADRNCRECHTTEMVLFQPAMTHAGWEAEVNKMRNVYKAPIDPKDIGAIVDYLTRIKGTQ